MCGARVPDLNSNSVRGPTVPTLDRCTSEAESPLSSCVWRWPQHFKVQGLGLVF